MSTVGYNTDKMRDLATVMDKGGMKYQEEIEELYNIIKEFVNSNDFKGGISQELLSTLIEKKKIFAEYSKTINEAIQVIKNKASNIDDTENRLLNRVRNNII